MAAKAHGLEVIESGNVYGGFERGGLSGIGKLIDLAAANDVLEDGRRFGSDNKVEADRARHALSLAESGSRVCVVSSGDPGIFAMASAVLECGFHAICCKIFSNSVVADLLPLPMLSAAIQSVLKNLVCPARKA